MEEVLHTEVDDGVAHVVMTRPPKRNPLNGLLLAGLKSALAGLDKRDDVHAIGLTGADPAFCAGLDLKELQAGDLVAADGGSAASSSGFPIPADMGTPLIGAVNGVAVTGGLEVALGCDFLIASTAARFADTHARVGILPGWGLTLELPRAIGLRRARQMSFTGNYVDAETALAWGLVNEVVPHDQVVERALALARDVGEIDGTAVAAMKRLYWAGMSVSASEARVVEDEVSRSWLDRGGFDRQALADKREQIQSRGSSQT